jgi:hypothetical protein
LWVAASSAGRDEESAGDDGRSFMRDAFFVTPDPFSDSADAKSLEDDALQGSDPSEKRRA